MLWDVTAARRLDPLFPNLRTEVVEGYRNAPASMVAEILNGDLSLLPRPRPRHAHAAARITGRLRGFSDPVGDDLGGWVILPEPELHLGPLPDVLVPDLAGWRRDRFPEGALDDDGPAALRVAPDWCCEILSPRTEALDRGTKLRIYRRDGVGHVWLVNPALRTLEVYRLHQGAYVLVDTFEGDVVVRAEPFDAIELPLTSLWTL